MSAPTASHSSLDHESKGEPGWNTGPVGNDGGPPQAHAATVIEQLVDLAGQISSWQRALVSTGSKVEALTDALAAAVDTGAVGAQTGQAAPAVGARQVRALVAGLAADAGTVTWLFIRAGHEPPAALSSAELLVARSLLTRAGPIRVLVCAPGVGPARALADANPGARGDWLRVAQAGAALGGIRSDLLVATGADAITMVPGPDGAPCADTVRGGAINTLVRVLVGALWDGALPLASAERIEEVAHDPMKVEILGLLKAGAKDEAIARALGVSLRTCRRHIAELLSAVDAGSRFQAASRFARAGLLGAGTDQGAGTAQGLGRPGSRPN